MVGVKIIGTGSSLPKNVLTNFDLEKMVETSNDWIIQRTGISERRIAQDETNLSLSLDASLCAIEDAKIDKSQIGLIVFASITQDYITPASASLIQKELGIKKACAFDIAAGCSGFVYALAVAKSLMESQNHEYALVVGCDVLSKITNWQDRSTCILFGDGAGAVVLKRDEEEGILASNLTSYPDETNSLYCESFKINNPFSQNDEIPGKLVMDGRQVFRFATSALVYEVTKVLQKANLDIEKIKYIVPHQANKRIIDYAAEKLNVSEEKFIVNVNSYGNTSAASVPICLDEINKKGLLCEGDYIVLVAFGAGLTSGALLLKW